MLSLASITFLVVICIHIVFSCAPKPKYSYEPFTYPGSNGTNETTLMKVYTDPEAWGFPDVSKFVFTPDFTPIYIYWPSPNNDGAYLKVIFNEIPEGTMIKVKLTSPPEKASLYGRIPVEISPETNNGRLRMTTNFTAFWCVCIIAQCAYN